MADAYEVFHQWFGELLASCLAAIQEAIVWTSRRSYVEPAAIMRTSA